MSETVLVLNTNFEPINVCNMRRAIGLLLSEKASLVLDGRGEIKSCNQSFPRPSIIQLRAMVHRPRPRVKLTRREIFRRDHYTCQYCGKHSQNLTIDHVIPRHLGGQHVWENVVTACSACNHRKGGRTTAEAGMKPIKQPKEPPLSARYLFAHYLEENAEWETYLLGW
ncbi:MAG: HNH endonuclease [Anaerolineae bacterium]|nr:HNH endonuclease [Anaerolineae bacterium]